MAAISGSPWRGLAVVRVADTVGGGTRAYSLSVADVDPLTATGNQSDANWQGDADGGSWTLRLEWASSGSPTFGAADTVDITMPNTSATKTVSISGDSGSSTFLLYRSSTPWTGSTRNRAYGDQAQLNVRRTTAITWNARSDGSSSSLPAATTHTWAIGYWRSRMVLQSHTLSNVAVDGAEPATFASPDTTYQKATFNHDWEFGSSFFFKHRQSGADVRSEGIATLGGQGATPLSGASTWASSAAKTTLTGRINGGYAVGGVTVRLTTSHAASLINSNANGDIDWAFSPTQITGWTVASDGAYIEYVDRFQVDPRVTFSQHIQANDNTWGTPPSTKHIASLRRLVSDMCFVASRAVNARGEGFNGLVWTEKLWDAGGLVGTEGSPVKTRTSTGTTQGGVVGYSDGFLTWDNVLPGGSWTHKRVITTTDMTLGEVNGTGTFSLLAFDSQIVRLMLEGDLATPSDHWYPGKALAIGVGALKNGIKVTADSARIWIIRPKIGAGGDVTTEYLAADRATWTTGDPGDANAHALAVSVDDAKIYRINFTGAETAAWSYYDVGLAGEVVINGTPYPVNGTLTVTGLKNKHSTFDNISTETQGQLPEARVTFDSAGHAHTGGATGAAIGER